MAAPIDEEQTEFTLKLIQTDGPKVSAIKAIAEITGCGRMEAKDILERAPTEVLRDVSRAVAERGKALLDKAGAWSVIE